MDSRTYSHAGIHVYACREANSPSDRLSTQAWNNAPRLEAGQYLDGERLSLPIQAVRLWTFKNRC